MKITRINKANGVRTILSSGTRKLQQWQLLQSIDGNKKFQEAYIQGHNYFKHMKASYIDGKPIKGSWFSETFIGEEANKRQILDRLI